MRLNSLFAMLSFFLAAANPGAAQGASANAGSQGGALDQKKIHAEYNEGSFERVTAALESFMARNKTYSLDDSIFIAKHLAVVYSANPQTREKGKYYMYRLLALLPSAKLVDMYVSDEIDRIFDKVREEFMTRQKAFGVDSTQIAIPDKSPSKTQRDSAGNGLAAGPQAPRPGSKQEESGVKPGYIIAGGALVAMGLATYFIFSDSPETKEKTYVVP